MSELDQNKDGGIDLDEFQNKIEATVITWGKFKQIDSNNDGKLGLDEADRGRA